MNFSLWNEHRVATLVSATVVLQLSALGMAFYLRSAQPERQISIESLQILSDKENAAEAEPPILLKEDSTEQPATLSDSEIGGLGSTNEMLEVPESSPTPSLPENTSRLAIHKVVKGDNLAKIWKRYGAKHAGVLAAAKAFAKAKIPVTSLQLGELIELHISQDDEVTSFKKKLKNGRQLILEGDSQQGYQATIKELQVGERQRTISGTIQNSFVEAAAQELPYAVVDDLVDLFSHRVEFRRDIQPGDSFSVVLVEKYAADGSVVGDSVIKAASLRNAGNILAVISYPGQGGTNSYYDEKGEPIGEYFLRYPLKFSRISSVFSNNRLHPVLGIWRPHPGIDFAAPVGTPVRSVAAGVVTYAGYSAGAGNIVKIQHSRAYSTYYMHLSKFAKGLSVGDRVKRGELVGAVGSTGLASGPHLDFRFLAYGKYVNPLTMKLPRLGNGAERLPDQYRLAMLRQLKKGMNTRELAALQSLPRRRKVS